MFSPSGANRRSSNQAAANNLFNKSLANHEASREREDEPAISDESFEYKPPYQVPHKNETRDLGPNENIRGKLILIINLEEREESERSWTPPEEQFPQDQYRRPSNRELPPEYNGTYGNEERNNRNSGRDFIFSGSRAPAKQEPASRSVYPEPEPFRRPSKTGNYKRQSSNNDQVADRVDSRPVRVGGKRPSYSRPSQGMQQLIIV